MSRQELAARVETVGQQVNALREQLLQAGMPFTAGMTRSAEETLVVVFNALNDTAVRQEEL
jgi:hypothetical protein